MRIGSRMTPDILVSATVAVALVLALWVAKDWDLTARLFPWAVGLPLLALVIVQLAVSIHTAILASRGPIVEESPDRAFAPGPSLVASRARFGAIIGWTLAFAGLIWALGFPIGGTLTTLLYLRLAGHERWRIAVIVATGTALFFWVTMTPLVAIPYPPGALFALFGLRF